MTSNGVIHIIDAVLVPPSIDAAAFLETCKQGVVDSGMYWDTYLYMDSDRDVSSDKDEESSSSSSLYGSIVGLTIIAGVSALL